jgi:hypothetical protein
MNHQSSNRHRSFLNSWKNSSSSTGSNRNRHHDRGNNNSNHTSNRNNTIVGTEKIAYKALQRNTIAFQYPKLGFITKIEYSLLYTMMNHPEIYPKNVIYDMIQQEDYIQFIYVNEPPTTTSTTTTTSDNTTQNDHSICSYAQLSALLALAAEKWPPPSSSSSFQHHEDNSNGSTPSRVQQQQQTTQRRNYNDDDDDEDDEYDEYHQRRRQRQEQSSTGNTDTTTTTNSSDINIVQTLCQLLIQCIIRHCNEHQLDRETEINELFVPFQKVVSDQANRSALLSVVPAYIGMTATILTGGNPIPFYIGYAMSINAIAQQEKDLANYKQIASTTSRMSNIETTNLLHDTD